MSSDAKPPPRPFKIWSCDRQLKKAVVVSSFDELKEKGRQKLSYDNSPELVVVLENDGTEVEDDVYFNTLEKDTVFLLLRPGEKWLSSRVLVEHYSGDSYGIQIRDVTSAAQPQGNRPNLVPIRDVSSAAQPLESRPNRKPVGSKVIRRIEQAHVKESSSSDDEFFLQPLKEDVREFPKSIHYFRDLALGKYQPTRPDCTGCTNSSSAKSKLQTARKTNKPVCATEDAIAAEIISSDLPERVESAIPKTARGVRLSDERIFWSHAATQQLIQSYIYYRPHFNQPKGQLKVIWRLVAKKMQLHGFKVSAKLCDKKWRNLKMTYRAITKKMSLGSIKTRKSWQYYGLMRQAMTTRPVRQVSESEGCSEVDMDCDWLAEFFHQKKEQEIQELEEIRRVSHHSIEQLRKENESLQLLNDYLASCVTK